MSQEPAGRDAISAVAERSSDLTEEYTRQLDEFVNTLVPPMLSNSEYAARTSALMIALNRELARCAAAFGEVHGVTPEQMTSLIGSQFARNFETSLAAVRGQGNSIQ